MPRAPTGPCHATRCLSPRGARQCRHRHMVRLLGRSRARSTPRPGGPRAGQPWGPRSALGGRSVAGQVFVLQVVIVLLLIVSAVVALVLQVRHDSTQEARNRSLAVAETFANAPGTREALSSPHPTLVLQPQAEAAGMRSHVDFIVVMNTDGIRYTHPAGPDRQEVRREHRPRGAGRPSHHRGDQRDHRAAGAGHGSRQGARRQGRGHGVGRYHHRQRGRGRGPAAPPAGRRGRRARPGHRGYGAREPTPAAPDRWPGPGTR